jgi:hypothetical protein
MDFDLTKLTEEDLLELNRRVVDQIRILRQARCLDSMVEFNLGDRVTFKPGGGREIIGTVVRRNQKSITVATADGHQWRVSPTLLTKGAAEVANAPGSVISLAEHRRREG